MKLENILKRGKSYLRKSLITGIASSLLFFSYCDKNLPTSPKNNPPEIYSSPITSIEENKEYRYQVLARDIDGDNLSYSLFQKPSWLSISQSGVISGTAPNISEDKTENVKIQVSDGKDFVSQSYYLNIKNKEVEGDFVLGENTSVFPASFIENYISSVDPNKLVFTSPVTLSVGGILVGENSFSSPDGFLRKITSISSDKKTVYTTSATIEQGIYNGAFLKSHTLSPSGIKKFIGKKGISKSSYPTGFDFSLNFDNVVLFDEDGNNLTIDDQITVTGNYAFTTQFGLGLNIDEGKLENLLFDNTTKESSSLKMLLSKNWQEPFEKEFNLAKYSFNPFVLCWIPTVPPFPVVVRPEMDIFTGVSFASAFPSEISVSQEALLKAGLEYNNNSWNLISYFSNDFDFSNPFSEGNSETKAHIEAKLSLMLYGIMGPGTTVKDNLKLVVSENSWKLSGGLEALVGINMGVFSNSIEDVNKTIFDYEKLLAEGEFDEEPTTSTMTDPRDDQIYNIVKIGDQWWMAENLNYNHENSGYYNDDTSYEENYGRLYGWEGACESCPLGWKLPTQEDWGSLIEYLGYFPIGGKLKSTGTVEEGTGLWHSPNKGATNESGFTALPGGRRTYHNGGSYWNEGYYAYFWEAYSDALRAYFLRGGSESHGSISSPFSIESYNDGKENNRYSVRCVKDE